MPLISQRVRQLQPSPIRRFFGLVEQITDAISLSIGEPDFVTPWHIREAAMYSLEKGYTHYAANQGVPELRQEVACYLERRYGMRYDPDTEILITVGVSEALDLTYRALVEPGDQVLIVEPAFVSYNPIVILAGGEAISVSTREEDGFKVKREQIEAALTASTKIINLSYPNNPTGAVMTHEELLPLAELVAERDLFVVSDEIYSELTYNGEHCCFAALPEMKERTVLLNGFSKGFAMTGWRLGYAAAPAEIIAAMTKIHAYTTMSVATVTQKAAAEALQSGDREVARMRQEYNQRRRLVVGRLRLMGLDCFEPQGAFYVFPSICVIGLSSEEFAERLLREEKVAVIPGNAFGAGGEGYVRCSYATALPDLEEALRRMARFMERHHH